MSSLQSLEERRNLFQRHFATLSHPLASSVERLLMVSDYACRYIEILKALLDSDEGIDALSRKDYEALLFKLRSTPLIPYTCSLRYFRHYHFLRLMLRELHGIAGTEETMRSWSDCADALILATIDDCHQTLQARYGVPKDDLLNTVKFYVLAMGKLGGRELNYSSDIDLIFAYSSAGFTNGPESIANEQYFTKLAQLFIQRMQQVTTEGFVFRVDLRLRPNGDSGALVSSLAALETYYQEQGRDWERYAMVKARLLGQEMCSSTHWFNRLIIPFTYRRYIDFSVIGSLRSMKAMIEREVQLNPRLDDIKRGLGGIREIEFIIQNVQLIRGGRLPVLRKTNALAALAEINKEGLIPHAALLKKAYLFLRKLENCLQSQNDQQTHSLPQEALKQRQIALAMDYDTWAFLQHRLQRFQAVVSHLFHSMLSTVDYYEDDKQVITSQLTSIWQGHVESSMAINWLSSLGYQEAERCYQLLYAFRHGSRCRRLNQTARLRLDHFMVVLLKELIHQTNTEAILLQVLQLLDNIVGRSAYLALLIENPHALKELLYWFARSSFIRDLIVNHPFLLELLLSDHLNWRPMSRQAMAEILHEQLLHSDDNEVQQELLRQFKLSQCLLAARAKMRGRLTTVRAGQFLADLAEVIVNEVINLACKHLSARYPSISDVRQHLAIIAYGKLGSRELNYQSDLDLVFIHTLQGDEPLLLRLTQKILFMLTTRSQSGILYPVDTRLRPSGEAGLLVSSLPAFIDYQQKEAWTWEHQALIRARMIVGKRSVRAYFNQSKQAILVLPRSREKIRNDMQTMREKMDKRLRDDPIKQASGGLIDLEFLVQFLVLTHALAGISQCTHTLHLLKRLMKEKILTREAYQDLQQAYCTYHEALHQRILGVESGLSLGNEQEKVKRYCEYYYATALKVG